LQTADYTRKAEKIDTEFISSGPKAKVPSRKAKRAKARGILLFATETFDFSILKFSFPSKS
jgi:hypothetical protein